MAAAVLSASSFTFAAGEGWSSDFAASKAKAAESKADLLMDFTGSDWCGWCIRLDKEVFSHEAFKKGVEGKFVLVEIDSPRDKTKLSEETQAQNKELVKTYGVRGYPTILLCDAEGKPYAKTGYRQGGPEAYVENLDELRASRDKRDVALASAEKLEGVEKAKALIAALDSMGLEDEMVAAFYGDITEQIKAADPKDETGYVSKAEAKARLDKVMMEIGTLARAKDFDGAIAAIDAAVKSGDLGAMENQRMLATKAMIYAQLEKFDESLKAVDEAKAADPESELIQNLDEMKKRIAAEMEKGAGGADPAP